MTCIDVDASKIAQLDEGRMPIYEPGLDALVERNIAQRRLRFTTEFEESVGDAELIFIAVGTPSRRGDGHADLSFVYDAVRRIAPLLRGYSVVVDKSTVPIGTARQVRRIIAEVNPDVDFDVASNPEFPPRRRRDWRFHAPGPRGHRRGKPPCGGEAAGAVSAAQPRRGPDRGHRSGVRGAHQVRRQCLSRNEG